MKKIDFILECPECNTALHVPLQVKDNINLGDGSHFNVDCYHCNSEIKVTIQISTAVVIASTLKN